MDFEMTNFKHAARPSESASDPTVIPNRRLWFEFVAAAVAWLLLGSLDSVVAWRACVHQEQYGAPSSHPGARIVYFVLWIVLFGLLSLVGAMSYCSWRALSGENNLLSAEGRERREFMSLSGLFISVTLSMGFFWMCLPLFLLQMCARAR
jgi:hypothetical protein